MTSVFPNKTWISHTYCRLSVLKQWRDVSVLLLGLILRVKCCLDMFIPDIPDIRSIYLFKHSVTGRWLSVCWVLPSVNSIYVESHWSWTQYKQSSLSVVSVKVESLWDLILIFSHSTWCTVSSVSHWVESVKAKTFSVFSLMFDDWLLV